MIFARLQVADGEHERPADAEFPLDRRPRHFALNRPELPGDGVGHHHDLLFVDAVVLQNRTPRKLARSEHARGALQCPLHRQPQLERAKPGEVLRIFQIADIVHADHQGNRAEHRAGVLHVQHIRTIAAKMPRQVHAQALVRIHRDTPRLNAAQADPPAHHPSRYRRSVRCLRPDGRTRAGGCGCKLRFPLGDSRSRARQLKIASKVSVYPSHQLQTRRSRKVVRLLRSRRGRPFGWDAGAGAAPGTAGFWNILVNSPGCPARRRTIGRSRRSRHRPLEHAREFPRLGRRSRGWTHGLRYRHGYRLGRLAQLKHPGEVAGGRSRFCGTSGADGAGWADGFMRHAPAESSAAA